MSAYNTQDLVDNLNYLDETKRQIKQSIISKGQTVNDNDPFRSYATKIENISSSLDSNIFWFKNKEEMNQHEVSNIGDIAIIYNNSTTPITSTGVMSNLYIPYSITLPEPIIDEYEVSAGTNANCLGVYYSPEYVRIDFRETKLSNKRFYFESTDGIHYTYAGSTEDLNYFVNRTNINILNSSNPSYFNIVKHFLCTNINLCFDGIYEYNNGWELANTQLNASNKDALNSALLYSNEGTITGTTNINLSGVYTKNALRVSLYNLQPIVSNIDLSLITNGCNLFLEYKHSHIPINLNFTNLTNMVNMFRNSSIASIQNFDTSKVTHFNTAFINCNMLSSVPNFDLSNAKSIHTMFWGCNNLVTVPNFNTSNVSSFASLFYYCNNLATVPNFDTSNAIYTNSMFCFCRSLNNIPNFNLCNVKNATDMFGACNMITSLPNFNFTDNLTDMNMICSSCYNLVTVPQWYTKNVKSMCNSFNFCNNLSTASIHNIINMALNSNITDSNYKTFNASAYNSPFYGSNITSSRYSNRLSEITAAGWSY